MNELNTNNSKKIIILISVLFCAVFLIIGGTLAYFTDSDSKQLSNVVTSNITLDYDHITTYMRNNIIPVVEEDVTKFASKNSKNNYTDNDICHYKDDMYACSLYEFTIINRANITQHIIVSMNPIINEYNNLYFTLYESKANEISTDLNPLDSKRKIEQDSIVFNNVNLILNPNDSKTYTIVFYIKSLDIPQDDINKKFSASIMLNSITTGYKNIIDIGEGCYNYTLLEDNTIRLNSFISSNINDIGINEEICGVTKDIDGYYSVIIPITYAGLEVSQVSQGNPVFSFYNQIKEIVFEGVTDKTSKLKLIGENFLFDTMIESLTIPASVEIIDNYAFESNQNLKSLTFVGVEDGTSRLEYIGDCAFTFHNLSYSIESPLVIPSSVKHIGRDAFFSRINQIEGIKFLGIQTGFGDNWHGGANVITE